MQKQSQVTPAVILAGGAGRRIGGDKGLQPLGRGTLLSAICDRLAGQVGALALNAVGDAARFAPLSLPVLPDPMAGQPGPLAGVMAALDWARGHGADRVLVVPCDTPFLPSDLLALMAAQPGLVVARDDAGVLHPTVALWPVAMAGAVRAALAAGERRLRMATAGAAVVTFPAHSLRNINTAADLALAQPFDRVLVVDWSGGADRGPRPVRDAIWAGWDDADPVYLRNRDVAADWLSAALDGAIASGQRVLLGCDFAFAYPAGFAARVTGRDDPLALWDWLANALPADAPPAARFDLAGRLNQMLGGDGPFWGNGLARDIPGLPRRKPVWRPEWPPHRRLVEAQTPGTFTQWQLSGAGAVGSQTLTGLPVLSRLRARFGADLTVWPFQPPAGRIVLAEVWPSLIGQSVRRLNDPIPDRAQVRLLSRALAGLPPGGMAALMDRAPDLEGWILGAGHETLLRDTAARIVADKDSA